LVIDDTDNPRSKSANKLAYLYKLRDKESGGYVWGQSLVFLCNRSGSPPSSCDIHC
jgi:hypothetical protein